MATRNEIVNTKNTVKGLCKMACQLGYKDPAYQLINSDGSVVGDLLYFLEDNPGVIEAIKEWVLNTIDLEEDEDEDKDNLKENK